MTDKTSVLEDINTSLDIDDWFPDEVSEEIRFHSTRFGVPSTFLSMPFLVISSYLSQHTNSVYLCRDIETGKEIELHKEPTILYSMVVGESGSNKTSCIRFFIDILDGIKNVNNAEHMYETGTLDGLVKTLMKNNNTAVGLYDEIGTFNDGLDKGSTGSFDRSVYLSLYNAKKFLKSTKTSGDVNLNNPRFSLFTFTQEEPMKKFMLDNLQNGFFQRFLLSYPPEKVVLMAEKKQLMMVQNQNIDLRKVLQHIYNRSTRSNGDITLQLSKESMQLYDIYHDNFQENKSKYPTFEKSIRSKSVTLLMRLAGVTNLIRNAVEEIKSTDSNFVPDSFINEIDMKRALSIVQYGVENSIAMTKLFIGNVTSNSSKQRNRREFVPVPESENMNMDYLLANVRYTRNILKKEEIELRKITRDKMYPHTSDSSTQSSIYGHKFVAGIVAMGLGVIEGIGKKKTFRRFNPGDNDEIKKKWNELGMNDTTN